MKKILSSTLLAMFLLAFAGSAFAQNIAGTYTMKLSGKQVYTDRTPVEDAISGSCSFTITQTGDEITVQARADAEQKAQIMVRNRAIIAIVAALD